MEKNNKKRVFTGTVAMLVILFGLLRIAIFTGYHMVTPFLPEIARNLDTTIVVIGPCHLYQIGNGIFRTCMGRYY